ncbi:MAG TPA: helix-turn-helix transcriptional regulator [Terriglobia bacterium]|nr:helix-turn-helix transcriptional regulator [Terriglobia bacterium]
MLIGVRLRELREERNLSQGDIEKRTGLLRCYISRVENGHTVPSLETLEKLASALEIPLYQLFTNGTEAPALPHLSQPVSGRKAAQEQAPSESDRPFLRQLGRLLCRIAEPDRELVLHVARKLATR